MDQSRSGHATWCILLSALITLTTGCASTLHIYPNKSPDQRSSFNNGVETVYSEKQTYASVGLPSEKISSDDRIALYVFVKNTTTTTFEFSTENIIASCDSKPVKVFTYEEIRDEIRQNRRDLALAAAFRGFANTLNASSNTRYQGTVQSPTGRLSTFSGEIDDPSARIQAQASANAELRNDLQSINDSSAKALASVEARILKKQTVAPGKIYGGVVQLAPLAFSGERTDLVLKASVKGEVHEFRFAVARTALNRQTDLSNQATSIDVKIESAESEVSTQREVLAPERRAKLDVGSDFIVKPIAIDNKFGIPFAALSYTKKGFEHYDEKEYGIAKKYWERVIEAKADVPGYARQAAQLLAYMYEIDFQDYETGIHYYTIQIEIAEDLIKASQKSGRPYFPDDIVQAYQDRGLAYLYLKRLDEANADLLSSFVILNERHGLPLSDRLMKSSLEKEGFSYSPEEFVKSLSRVLENYQQGSDLRGFLALCDTLLARNIFQKEVYYFKARACSLGGRTDLSRINLEKSAALGFGPAIQMLK